MTHSITHQVLAAVWYRKANGNVRRAACALKSDLQALQLQMPTNCEEYVKTWGPRMRDDGSIEGHAQHSGRKPELSE